MEKSTDSIGNPLYTGSFVIYEPTGTKGYVTEIMSDEEGIWALIDKTNLYYKTEVLKVIKEIKDKESEEITFSRETISDRLEKEKEIGPIEMSDASLESGG